MPFELTQARFRRLAGAATLGTAAALGLAGCGKNETVPPGASPPPTESWLQPTTLCAPTPPPTVTGRENLRLMERGPVPGPLRLTAVAFGGAPAWVSRTEANERAPRKLTGDSGMDRIIESVVAAMNPIETQWPLNTTDENAYGALRLNVANGGRMFADDGIHGIRSVWVGAVQKLGCDTGPARNSVIPALKSTESMPPEQADVRRHRLTRLLPEELKGDATSPFANQRGFIRVQRKGQPLDVWFQTTPRPDGQEWWTQVQFVLNNSGYRLSLYGMQPHEIVDTIARLEFDAPPVASN